MGMQEHQVTLLEFYNKVFVYEVQDMMSREERPRYQCTPIREDHLRGSGGEGEGSNPWFSSKAPPLIGPECRTNYREQ
jgi:hypothetical protein